MEDQIMEQEPENGELQAEVYFQLSLVEWDQHHLDEALELAKKSFGMTPDKTFKRYLIAELYREKNDDRMALAGLLEDDIRYDEALGEINLQLELDQDELYFCERSNILLRLQRKDEATATLEQALEIYPSGKSILVHLVLIYKDDGHCREAADCLERFIQSGAVPAFAYEWLAQCLKELNDNERREEVLNEGIREFSQHPGLYYERAELWRDEEQYDKMAKDSKMYVELADCAAASYLQTGDAYCLMGDHDEEAIRWYEKGLEVIPDAWVLWQAMGLVYRDHVGDCKKAIACLEKALKYRADPMYMVRDRRLLLTQIIEACEKQGDKGKLKKYVRAMLELLLERPVDEYNAEMFRQIGNCYLKLGNEQWAEPYLKRADDEQLCKRYAEQSEEGLFDLGVIQEELGQEKEALKYYQRALVLCQYENELNPCQCKQYEEAVARLSAARF